MKKYMLYVVVVLSFMFLYACNDSEDSKHQSIDGDIESIESEDTAERETMTETETSDETDYEQTSENETMEQEQPACVGWDDSTMPEDPFAEFCGDQQRYLLPEATRLDHSCHSNSQGVVGREQAGDMMAMRLRAEKPFHLTKIKAKFKYTGTGRLHIMGDYGRSWPDVNNDLTDPIDFEITEENEGKYIEFDLSDRHIEIHPRNFFWVVYEHLAPTPKLATVSGCDTGPSESRYKVQAQIEDWRNQGLSFVWGAFPSDTHFALEVYGEYFCEQVHPFYFTDITEEALPEKFSFGRTAWVDVDGDGFDDLIVHSVHRRSDCNNARIFKNNGDGTFTEKTETSGLLGLCTSLVAAGDVNNDGFIDLFLGVYTALNQDGTPEQDSEHKNLIMLGHGDFTFTKVEDSGVEALDPTAAAAFADYDKDGCLDLFYGNWLVKYPNPPAVKDRLFHGNCDGTFDDVTDAAGLSDQGPQNQPCYGAIWGDYNNDSYPDLFVMNYGYGENFLWENQGDGTFINVGMEKGIARDEEGVYGGNTFGVDLGDINSDGVLDIYMSEIAHPRYQPWSDPSRLMINAGEQLSYSFINVTRERGIFYDEGEIEPSFVDVDNDGDLDLFVSILYTGHWARLYRQLGDGKFLDTTFEAGIQVEDAQNHSWADIDHDGDMDLVIGQRGTGSYLHIFRNDTPSNNHWIAIRLIGTQSNKSAIGARIELTSCGRTQLREITGGKGHFGSQKTMWAHFGLGKNRQIDSIKITWPSGIVQTVTDAQIDSYITITESE